MKRLLSVLLVVAALAGLQPGLAAAEEAPRTPTILLDGLPLGFDVPPKIVDGRTMVPFRAIAEALGVTVIWHNENRSIEAYGPGTAVYLVIGSSTMWVNGTPVELDVPPMIVDSRTLLPLRAFSTAFGAQVGWDGDTYTVTVTSPVREMRMMAFYAIDSFPNRHLIPNFSDAAYGWAQFRPDGTVDLEGPVYQWPQPAGDITGERLLADAAAAGTRRYLMIHNVDDNNLLMTQLVLDEAKIRQAAESVAVVVADKGFDGVMLDIELLGWSEQGAELERIKQGYVQLVSAVADRLEPAGKETAVALHPLNGWYHGYDYTALAAVADTMQIMAHDYVQGEPEPADRVEEAIQMAVAAVGEANRSKLLLGILFYETPETLLQKVGLAKRYGLGGFSFWRLGMLTPEDMAALESSVTRQR
ncbi:MAG TPA: stalk domain-containing protein [Symbiobacteriaceae bacterium]|nr:stalk domain-containing protein [Symbiobacteriaceae bacterium]